ncbi:MAG: zinc ribbon domain-containing protein [Bacilli bacterium]|nr:zinc ribbon domain-containing protein [Bacilli bacterium]
MAKTKIDNEFVSTIQRIISTQAIDDAHKENFRRLARDAMQIYGRSRAFASVLRVEGIITGAVIIMSIIFTFARQPAVMWVLPLTITVTAAIVFGILTSVFRSRYRARLTNLQEEFSVQERKDKDSVFPIVPYVCVIGPYVDSYRLLNVEVISREDGIPLPGYSNLGLTFIESTKGGTFDFRIRKIQGSLSIDSRECAIVTAVIQSKKIVFTKQRLKLPETAFMVAEFATKPTPEIKDSHGGAPSPMPQQPKKSLPIDQTPNELVEKLSIDAGEPTLSIPSGKVSFLVMKNEVCDMLKAGDYPFAIDSFPRLKALDRDALGNGAQYLRILNIDVERVYRIGWRIEGSVFAKGDVEFKITNPRLFLNCVIEDDLFLKTAFENEVLGLLKPSIINHLKGEASSDYDAIESNLLSVLTHSLDKFGLSVEFVGLNAFSKEEASSQKACVHCGKNIPGDSVFCPYCGKKQEDNVCPNCGAEIPAGAVFCPKCGSRKQ